MSASATRTIWSIVLRVSRTAFSVSTATPAIDWTATAPPSTPRTWSCVASEISMRQRGGLLARSRRSECRRSPASTVTLKPASTSRVPFFHRHDRLLRLGLHGLDQHDDVLGRLAGALGQLANLFGHDRETAGRTHRAPAASMAALSASRFVCEAMSSIVFTISEISSERSARLLTFFEMPCTSPRIRCMPARLARDGVLALGGGVERQLGGRRGGFRVLGDPPHRAAQAFHRVAHAHRFTRLRLGAAGRRLHRADHLGRARQDLLRGVAHVVDDGRQLADHHVGSRRPRCRARPDVT